MSLCAVTVVLLRWKPRQWLALEEVDLLLPGPEAMAAAQREEEDNKLRWC